MDLDPKEVQTLFFLSIGILLVSGLAVFMLMRAITRNHAYHEDKHRKISMEHANSILFAKLEMQENTFRDITREIHDNIKLSFVLSKANLHTIQVTNEKDKDKLASSIAMMEKGIADLDDLSLSLNTDWIKQIGLTDALEQEIEKLRMTGLFIIEEHFSGNQVTMEAERELLVFRIVQETFNNIIKHSEAKNVRFWLQHQPDHARFTITDDGKGFDLANPGGKRSSMGLTNVQLRAKILNAQLTINPVPGKGTTIIMTVPYSIAPEAPGHKNTFWDTFWGTQRYEGGK